ncbi:MAG TPA: hypothetical protein PL017_08695 [Tenuifilaceae bacterium]|nr:hypothetical protein [Tenuifilaceae bacterium]HPE19009.1 hypothetical protein [Tenuifilaceae bacterium]HPJ46162.1 hypothetical protein [Tenuifilaceae bacterium]HPQ34684.1 hypothetical protein [Tenuifilaceae bacterium]HRX68112.1 hypothetical protein [Tenuifilaceae bacterium]
MIQIAKRVLPLAIVFILSFPLQAQESYKTGVGLRGGYPSGITLKHFVTKRTAMEGILSIGWGYYGVTGLYQIHQPIPDLPDFNWYYGIGGHFAASQSGKKTPWSSATDGELYIGVDGVLGVEYVFSEAPISISVDILPILNIIESPGVWFNAGLSVRYVF